MKQREIKFRVFDKHSGKMVSADRHWHELVMDMDGELKWYKEREYQGGSLDLSGTADLVLMQYTGLRDKSDKDIYEFDIVVVDGLFDPETGQTESDIRVVQYVGASLAYVEYRANEGESIKDVLFVADVIGGGADKDDVAEVIGNVFETAELLEP